MGSNSTRSTAVFSLNYTCKGQSADGPVGTKLETLRKDVNYYSLHFFFIIIKIFNSYKFSLNFSRLTTSAMPVPNFTYDFSFS